MPTPQEVARAEQRRRLEAQRRLEAERQAQLPTPSIRPLPLPNIRSEAFRRLGTGPSGAVGPAQQPGRQLTPAEILRNVTAGGRLPTIPAPRTPARIADPRRGRGAGVVREAPQVGGFGFRAGGSLAADARAGLPPRVTPSISQVLSQQAAPTARQADPRRGRGFNRAVEPIPPITTPQSPFALNAGEFHQVMQWTSGRILQAVDAGSRNFLPGQITDVIATLLPWRDWGFESYQDALRALGYTEIPGAGTWIKDEEILSTSPVGAGGGTSTQFVTQRAGFGGGGGGGFRSPQFSTLINWRI